MLDGLPATQKFVRLGSLPQGEPVLSNYSDDAI